MKFPTLFGKLGYSRPFLYLSNKFSTFVLVLLGEKNHTIENLKQQTEVL